jgi:hypothetical protein
MFLNFNKKRTKQLIKASSYADGMTKCRLDWLEENKQSVCGNIYESWFSGNTVFIVSGYENEYKLFCSKNDELSIYLIEDIEEFLKFINIGELMSTNKEAMVEALNNVKPLPATGVVVIQNNKIFLYDFVGVKY